MSCYDVLLEEFNEEQELANATFASIAESVDALCAFVSEDVNLDMHVALESAEDAEALKEAAAAAVKDAFVKLGKKIKEWAAKIWDQMKKIAAKALAAVGNGGNAAMKKLISAKAVTKKRKNDLILKESGYKASQLKAIGTKLDEITRLSTTSGKEAKMAEVVKKLDAIKGATINKKDTAPIAVGTPCKELHDKYVAPYLAIDYKGYSETIKKASAAANGIAAELEATDAEKAAAAKDQALALMRSGSALVKFAFDNLTLGMSNAVKIALACGASAKKEEEAKEEA